MSPEQATRVSTTDRLNELRRVDLYEMATGRRPFHRDSAPQTLTAIIQDEPEPIATLNPKIPGPVRWIVERCLAKEARGPIRLDATTWRATSPTVRDHLSEVSGPTGDTGAAPVRRSRRPWIPAAVAAALLLAAGVAVWRLRQSDYFWKNPLTEARFTRLTDWEGSERDAALSPDGNFVVFLSDRAGPYDAWVGHVGGRDFLNLTNGRFANLSYPMIGRGVGFSDDGAHVSLLEIPTTIGRVWFIPTVGGSPQLFLQSGVSLAWSADKKQLVYHTGDPGDPLFVADRTARNPKKILHGKPGTHTHFPIWSPDGRFVYYIHGIPPVDTNIWRMRPAGGAPERLTSFHSNVAYPTFIDDRTLLYTAVGEDGAWRLHAMDVDRRIPHRVSSGLEEYTSLSSSADGRRLVAAVANPTLSLWYAPISDRVIYDSGLQQLSLRRFARPIRASGRSSSSTGRRGAGPSGSGSSRTTSRPSSGRGARERSPPRPRFRDGSQVAFAVRTGEHTRLYAMSSDGTNARILSEALDVRDSPSWSPDGGWIAVIASAGDARPLFKVPVGGGDPVRLAEGILANPVWSPDGRFILIPTASAAARSCGCAR